MNAKQAKACFDMAKAATNAEIKSHCLDLAKNFTELAGAIERLIELRSELDNVRRALTMNALK
jgi:outer membrane protein TolC